MKLIGSISQFGLRFSRVLLFSTHSKNSSSPSEKWIYRRILPLRHQTDKVPRQLNQWVEEGRELKQAELHGIMRRLRRRGDFETALRVLEWMMNKGTYNLSPQHIAIRLDLIAKVHSVTQAEKYFDSVPNNLKVGHVYGALLNCYAFYKCVDKAEAVMQKNRELGFFDIPLPYNTMLNLYSMMGKHEKIDILVQEMKNKGIKPDATTYSIQLNAFAATHNLEAMKKLLKKMKADRKVKVSWIFYFSAANCCLRAGLVEQAATMLKRAEERMGSNPANASFETLLTVYASMGYKDEVYRIWDRYKSLRKLDNSSYRAIISSLVKLDDLDCAQKILVEWLSCHDDFDVQIPGMVIDACCKKGLVDKAEANVSNLIEHGKEPGSVTWAMLATQYCTEKRMDKAVEAMKKAALVNQKQGYIPDYKTLDACLMYLNEKGDIEEAVELLRLRAHVPEWEGRYRRGSEAIKTAGTPGREGRYRRSSGAIKTGHVAPGNS